MSAAIGSDFSRTKLQQWGTDGGGYEPSSFNPGILGWASPRHGHCLTETHQPGLKSQSPKKLRIPIKGTYHTYNSHFRYSFHRVHRVPLACVNLNAATRYDLPCTFTHNDPLSNPNAWGNFYVHQVGVAQAYSMD